MFCSIMLCCVVLRPVMLCCATFRYATLCCTVACYVVQRLVCYGSLWYVVQHVLRSVFHIMLCSYTYFTKCSCVLYCAVYCLGCIAFPCFVALRCLALRCNKYVTVRYWMSSEVTLSCDTVRDLMSSEVMLPCDTCYGSLCRGVIWYTTIRCGMVCFCKQRHGMLWYNWGLYGTL